MHGRLFAGCDGARSTTREHLGIGFPGGTYEHLFYVADVQATGQAVNGDLNIALERSDFLVVFPLKGEGRARFIGTVKDDSRKAEELSWESVNKGVVEHLRTEVQRVNWFSTYRVHHRVADRFRKGRSFLLGDAAHIHSPVGGQGMNTGIGDAVNLAWKLAAVLRGRAKVSLLDTYEPERIAFARRLVATTDRAFTTVTSSGWLARFVRLRIVPVLAPLLFSSRTLRRFLFRTVSQVNVNYRGSSLSRGRVGSIHAGDRLPWVKTDPDGTSPERCGGLPWRQHDNFAPLKSLDWQLHVYGEAAPEVRALSVGTKVAAACVSMARGDEAIGIAAQCSLSGAAGWLHRSCGRSELCRNREIVPRRMGFLVGLNLSCPACDRRKRFRSARASGELLRGCGSICGLA